LNIDYLQIDLEVNNKSTLDVLNVFDSSIFDKYKFATVTFEHDIYTGDWFNTRNISREIFKKNGYILVFPDVIVYHGNGYGPFEDWYVHPELVDMNFINKIKKEQSLFHEDIRKIILNKLKYNEYHGEFQRNKYVDQVLREYFPDPNYKGIFFDVGAFDPIVISNSYHFEKNGWDVYCFEANTDLIKRLKEYRKNVFNYAISNENKEGVEFNIVNSGYWTAGFSAIEIGDEYKKICGWSDSFDVKKICVPQKTLNKIIEDEITTTKSIDIISIDIEGGELNCLKGLDINKYKPSVLVIENIVEKKDIEDYLKQFNYKLDKKIDYNEYYIKI
jgi:FkbM family methyltransferase